jgi:hypothetical protein
LLTTDLSEISERHPHTGQPMFLFCNEVGRGIIGVGIFVFGEVALSLWS